MCSSESRKFLIWGEYWLSSTIHKSYLATNGRDVTCGENIAGKGVPGLTNTMPVLSKHHPFSPHQMIVFHNPLQVVGFPML